MRTVERKAVGRSGERGGGGGGERGLLSRDAKHRYGPNINKIRVVGLVSRGTRPESSYFQGLGELPSVFE